MLDNYILIADDDLDDQLLLKHAFDKSTLQIPLKFVNDGDELIEYLTNEKKPSFILLDLNMPKKNGKDCLIELRENEIWKDIPTIIFSTSALEEDIKSTYNLGANSYIHKPTSFTELEKIVDNLGLYWFSTVKLPSA